MDSCPCCRQLATALYCRDCINAKLRDHDQKRRAVRDTVESASARANQLLLPGVRDESRLKADKWTLAVRIKDARQGSTLNRAAIAELRRENEDRRQALIKRKSNLVNARLRMTALVSPSSAAGSLSSLAATHAALEARHAALVSTLRSASRVLSKELLGLSLHSSSDPFLPSSHSLFSLALPPLGLLPTLATKTLIALLSYLCHITRLIAFYHSLALPFTPFTSLSPSLPGVPGLRTTSRAASSSSSSETPVAFVISKPKAEKRGTPAEMDDLYDAAAAVIVNMAFLAGVAATSTTTTTTMTSGAQSATTIVFPTDVGNSLLNDEESAVEDLGTVLERAKEGIGQTNVRWSDVRARLKQASDALSLSTLDRPHHDDDEDWVEV